MTQPVQSEGLGSFDKYKDNLAAQGISVPEPRPPSQITDSIIDAATGVTNSEGVGDLDYLSRVIHQINVEHGFAVPDRNFGEQIALIHSEYSEALEEHRSSKPLYYTVDGKPEGAAVEMLDGVIRVLDWFGQTIEAGLLVDEDGEPLSVSDIMRAKLVYNNGRPYKHGRAY